MIADYLNTGTKETPGWAFMGAGFNTLDENPQAQVDTKAYVSDKAYTSIIKGYQTQFPFDTDLIKSEEAIVALYDIGRNQKQGADAELEYCRVEIFKGETVPASSTYPARKFTVAVEVSGVSGAGAEVIHVTGNLINVGAFTDGYFNTSTMAFTEELPT
jgi:hypothetical protein